MDLPVLSDFPSDQERKLHLRDLKAINPPAFDPFYDSDPTRWGYLERIGRKNYRRTLDFNRGNLGYNIVINRRTRRPNVVPGTLGNDHHFVTLVNPAGCQPAIRIHFPSWDDERRGWKTYRDGEHVTLGNLKFILHETYRAKPRPEGAFEMYEELNVDRSNGSYGKVATVVNRRTAKVYALKIIRDRPIEPGTQEIPTFEISTLMALNHLNVCGIEEYFLCSDNTLHIVMEYAGPVNLFEYFSFLDFQAIKPIFSPSETTAAVMTQLCTAVEFIHSQGITHRDIKLDNVLLKIYEPFIFIKLADFGTADRTESIVNAKQNVICGHFEYIAPEMVKAGGYGNAVDAYSVGVVFYRMLLFVCGKIPPEIQGKDTIEEIVESLVIQRQTLWNPPNEFAPVINEARQLAEGLLKENPSERLSMTNALKNPWLMELGNKNASALQKYQDYLRENLSDDKGSEMDADAPPPLSVDPIRNARKQRVKAYVPYSRRRHSPRLQKLAKSPARRSLRLKGLRVRLLQRRV